MKKIALILALMFVWSYAGCANLGSGPDIPPDPPTQEELADLVGNWSGLTETTSDLWDKIDLEFYEFNDNLLVTFYLNDTYVDDIHVQYDGDELGFSSNNVMGEYGEFNGIINHDELIITGDFFYQSGISTTEGTFVVYKQ
jgi:hypothetical protein